MSTPPANSRGSREEGAAPPPLPSPPLPPPLVPPPPDTAGASVDTDNPWLGLASFTEATRAFFFGREQEITELERRVQRKLLTVLFGKSGLGKTSILQAGLVPGLRARGYFPVYLRIDYGHDSPEASEQIKQAINRAAAARAGERGESAGAAGEEAAARDTTAEGIAADEGAAQGSNGQVAAGQGAAAQGVLGHGTAAPAIDPEESIWEFLHHREGAQDSGAVPGDVSAATRTVKSPATQATAPPIATAPPRPTAPPTSAPAITAIPLLIFDQFEELFTLAQSDESGRARAARFVEELADLVENRPPKALEAKLDTDDSLSERFDFSRSDYRLVISLREDYLAPLESLKKQMPSLSQNRLRLAPMTGDQALEAVLLPGNRLRPDRPLVSEEVAEAIVRFVAGGAELANAEVEPSLLSLICRELNEQRLAQHHSEISLGLLAGSRESILGSFYERALADQPPAVRSLIEDELLTESGYRENLAEESLLRKLQTAGAAPDALAKLVNRRLLRIEERLDVRRVELTHDVLTGVVKASRDQRHEREARAATERLLAEQAARESAARRALRRARAIAAGCTALAVAAVIAALFAVINVQRARHAEADARQTRAVSEQARQQAEGLLGFLTDDFVRELETFGRYQTIADLSQREIDYFEVLPPQLKDPASIRSDALALINRAGALSFAGDASGQNSSAAEAVTLMQQLRSRGDDSESTAVVLARADVSGTNVAKGAQAALALLRPLVERPGAPADAVRAYIEVLAAIGKSDWEAGRGQDAAAAASKAVRLAKQLTAHQDDVTLNADYANAGQWLVGGLVEIGRSAEARRAAQDLLDVADRVLAVRPQFGEVLAARLVTETELGRLAQDDLDPDQALHFSKLDAQSAVALVSLEPQNAYYINAVGVADHAVGDALWSAGRLPEAVTYARKALDEYSRSAAGGLTVQLANLAFSVNGLSQLQSQLADWAAASATLAAGDSITRKLHLANPYERAFLDALRTEAVATIAYERDDFGTAQRTAQDALAHFRTFGSQAGLSAVIREGVLCGLAHVEGQAEYRLGRQEAAQSERTALNACNAIVTDPGSSGGRKQRNSAQVTTWLSMALAREGKHEEAAQTIAPVVTMYRALEKRNRGDRWVPLELAAALYAQSLTDDAQRTALLREAAALIEHLTPAIAVLHDTRAWRARIQAAQRTASGQVRR